MSDTSIPCVVIDESLPDWHPPEDAGIIITHMHYRWEELSKLRKILDRDRVPILVLSDGILEYRNTWENPGLPDGSLFQPLFGHKLACIGRGQSRVIESWGNAGKCEVVGLPRLDAIESGAVAPVQTSGPFRILIATANTPSFNDSQRATVVDSLKAVQAWFESKPAVGERPVKVTWRLSDGLDEALGVGDGVDPEDRPPIGEVIEEVDAVITTPSTMYLESVLRGRPTAILDFHNSPQYVTSAWTVSAAEQLDQVIGELADPPLPKMMFQQHVMNEQLECQTPAKPRLLRLIETMIKSGEQARVNRVPIELPARILTNAQQEGWIGAPSFDMADLYKNNPAFQDLELRRLQVELSAAVARLEQMPAELAEKNRYIAKLMRSLDRSRVRVEDMHNRVVAIRKRFGVEPAVPEDEK
jgi:hypothetical protein